MRVLVTGGAGMIGSHVAEWWAKKQRVDVVILDNLIRSKLFGYDKASVEYNWRYLSRYRRITRIKGDVRDSRAVLRALGRGADLVVHTAGQPGIGLSIRDPREDFSINAEGTLNVLECLRKRSPKACFIYCSTNKVYGENVAKIPLKETPRRYVYKTMKGIPEHFPCDLSGHTPYGVSKYVGDLYAQDYAHTFKMRTAVFRMSCIYGTRQFGFEDQGWLAWFAIANLMKKKATLYGDGKQVRDVLFVTDLVDAFNRFFLSGIKHDVYNIGGGPKNTLSLLECLELIELETGRKTKLAYAGWRPSDQKVYISDISKVGRDLGWNPKISPTNGLRELILWVKQQIGVWK